MGFLKKRWFLVLVVIILIGGGLIWYGNKQKATGKPYEVKRTDLSETLSFSGTVDAEDKATMSFQSTGKLSFVKAKEGDIVKRGQVLAGLDTGDLKAAVQAALYRYLAADANAKLVEDAVKNHDADESYAQKNQRVAAQTDRDIKYDDWLTAKRALTYATLVSPISGVVYQATTSQPGEFVTLTNQPQYLIVNPDSIFFSADADQADVVKIVEGKEAEITFDAYPNKPVKGVVTKIAFSPRQGETGTVYEVKLAFDKDPSTFLRLGMTGDVNFILSENKGVIAVPVKYIKTINEKKIVNKSVNGMMTPTEVTVGDTIEGETIILSGLAEGDLIYDQTK